MRHLLVLFALLLSGVVSAQIQVMPVVAQGQTQVAPTPPGLPTPNLWINGSDSTNYTHSVDIGGRIMDVLTTSDPNAYPSTALSSGNNRFKPSNNREAQYFNGQSGYTLGSASTFKYYHGGGAWTAYVTIKQLPMASSATQWNILKTIGVTTINSTVGLNIAYRNLTGTAVKTVRVALMNGAGGATGPFDVTCSNNSIIDNEYNVLKIVFTGSALRVYVINSANPTFTLIGSDLSGSGLSSADAAAPLNVGGTAAWTGYLKQVIFYDHNLTSGDEIDAENWIAADVLKVKVPQPANVYFIFGQSNVFGYSTSTNAQLPAYITGDLGTYTFWDAANSDANKIAFWDNYVVGQRTNPGVANENGALPRFAYDMKQKGIQTWFIVRGIGSTKMLPDGVVPSWSSDTTVSAADHYPIFTDRFTSDGLEEIEHVYRKTPVIKGLIKMQGETDAGDPANSTTPSIAAKTKYRYTKQWYAWCVNFVNYLNAKGYNTTSMRIANPRVHNFASGAWPQIQQAETNVMDSLKIKYPSLPIEHSKWIDTDNLNWSAPHYYYDGYDSIGKRLARYFINPIPVPPVTATNAVAKFKTINYGGSIGSRQVFIYEPANLGVVPTAKNPLGVFLHGDGARGSVLTGTPISPSNVGLVYSGNLANGTTNASPNDFQVLDGGVEIAHGNPGGRITMTSGGTQIGTVDLTGTNGAFTFTLPGSPSGAITVAYKYSKLLDEGLPNFIVQGYGNTWDSLAYRIGAQPFIFIMPQQIAGTNDWDNAYIETSETYAGANYRIDWKQKGHLGISRGGRKLNLYDISKPDSTHFTVTGTREYNGTQPWAKHRSIRRIAIHGTSDPGGSNGLLDQSYLFGSEGAKTQNEYAQILNLYGVAHNITVWDLNLFNTKTALFNFYREIITASKDSTVRADRMVSNAQDTKDPEDYRRALQVVNILPSGTQKTNRTSDLATLKSTIDTGKRRFKFDFGATTTSGWNNVTNMAAGQTVSSLVDDTGSSSSYSITINNAFSTGTLQGSLGTGAVNNLHGFETTVNSDGAFCEGGLLTGKFTINGLTVGKAFTLWVYADEITNNFSTNARLRLSAEGSPNQFLYTGYNHGIAEMKFTGVIGADGDLDVTGGGADTRGVWMTAAILEIQN